MHQLNIILGILPYKLFEFYIIVCQFVDSIGLTSLLYIAYLETSPYFMLLYLSEEENKVPYQRHKTKSDSNKQTV